MASAVNVNDTSSDSVASESAAVEVSSPSRDRAIRIAIDVGGTFTDVAVLDESDRTVRFEKVETTPTDPAVGVINGFKKAGVAFPSVSYFIHGTTLALNALHTRSGARVALVTTKGFRDVYLLGRTDREETYNLKYRRPKGLISRDRIYELPGRLDFQGEVLTEFDRAAANAIAIEIQASGVQSVAVCLLHSYANPAHELLMGEVLAEACPDVEVTLSHLLMREYREYERTSTAVIDAYVRPVIRRYLEQLRGVLLGNKFGGRFLVTHSGGGAMTVDGAIERPVRLILSGPAAGVIGASAFSALTGESNLIAIDMGGTSLDASLILGSVPTIVSEAYFQGQPISLPSLNIKTLGAGGGSLAWIDEAGHMHVGPRSAGAFPGPASYGRGGSEATVTDAALFLGYLGEQTALGGELHLNRALAETAIEQLGERLSLDASKVAAGIIEIVNGNVTGAVREITVERGYVPADFALLAYGGAGGLIAASVARALGIRRVIVPPGPGAFCAFGMLLTDVVHDFAQTKVLELARVDPEQLTDLFIELERRGSDALELDGFVESDTRLIRTADLRYAGQEHTVEVPFPAGRLTPETLQAIQEEFGVLHLARYGHRMDDPVEMVTARLRAVGTVPPVELPLAGAGDPARAHSGDRDVLHLGETITYQIHQREHLGGGSMIAGPAIIEEHTATTVIHAGDSLVVGDYGQLMITIGQEPQPRGTWTGAE